MKLKYNFTVMLLTMGLIPVLLVSIVLGVIGGESLKKELESQIHENLDIALTGLEQACTSAGNKEVDESVIDSLKEYDIELTVFMDGVRVYTSIQDKDGKRIIGTKGSTDIIDKVEKNGEEYYNTHTEINGEEYYAMYKPLKVGDQIVGMIFAGTPREGIESSSSALTVKTVFYVLLCIAFCAIVIVILTFYIRRPTLELTEHMKTLAKGDLSHPIETKSIIDEIRNIIFAAKELQNNLLNSVLEVRDSASTLFSTVQSTKSSSHDAAEGIGQVNTTIGEISVASVNMAEDVQDASSLVHQIAEQIGNVVKSTENLSEGAKRMAESSEGVSNSMVAVIDSNNNSVDASEEITKKIQDTNEIVQKINVAVDAIINISSQTNLLSLNASIEAARAGDAGKGFAVVADSIKALSTESGENAKEISDLANKIIEAVKQSVEMITYMSGLILSEREEVCNAQDKVMELATLIDESVTHIDSIYKNLESIDDVKNKITNDMESLSAISEQTAASSEEITASVETVTTAVEGVNNDINVVGEMTTKLQKSVDVFKTE